MSSGSPGAAHMNSMNTIKASDINLTEPLQDGLKAYMAATNQIDPDQWDAVPAHVKEEMGRHFLPFLWHSLPAILDQVNARITAETAATLNVPDSLEGLL